MPSASRRVHVRTESPEMFQAKVARVIHRLMRHGPTIVDVAHDMSINVRTLQRRLAASGTPFRALLDDCRRQRATAALLNGTQSIGQISQSLGYSDPSHFVRAFHRWTGHAPTHYLKAGRDTT